MNRFMRLAGDHFSNTAEIPSSGITLSENVRKMCEQNKCRQYGSNWTCPPAIKSVDEFRKEIAAYDSLLLVYQVYDIKSSFDWNGMMSGARDFKERLRALKKGLASGEPRPDFLILGAGGCRICNPCAYVDGEPCRNPEEAITSLEACGIDVMLLMKENGLKYNHGKNTVTYIGGLLYNQQQGPLPFPSESS